MSEPGDVGGILQEILARRHLPSATYRLQFNRDFTFADAQAILPYLHELGITDCYGSPILQARPGSMHGYDICDHGRISSDSGGPDAFEEFTAALHALHMGLLLDVVPNHMGIGDPSNTWWMDVLENGPSSAYAGYFDIDWNPVNPDLKNKVLLPLLGDQYGRVLERGEIQLAYEDGAFRLHYYETRLPVAPQTYADILAYPLPELAGQLGEEHPAVQELRSILTALGYLPPREERSPEKVVERNREKEIIKRRLAALIESHPEVRKAVETTVGTFNGNPADPHSFDPLDRLLEAQPYRLAYWRVAAEEINYRRFFDINELAAIRVEQPEVFQATHHLLLDLLAHGKADGLRIDHPDGLRDPAAYFRRLQEAYLIRRMGAWAGSEQTPARIEREAAAYLESQRSKGPGQRPVWPLYVVAEKILGGDEPLPHDWAIDGTTGYDFLNLVNGLFVDAGRAEALDAVYSQFIGTRLNFTRLVISSQKMIMLVSMASEVNALSHQLDRLSERNRRYRDFTLNSLTFAIREVIAAMFIYRTYIADPARVTPHDRAIIERAVEDAKAQNPRTAEAIFDFIRDTLLLNNIADFREEDRPRLLDWALKFQQLSAPVLAKGLEDTVFYVYNRLVSLNEVGGTPERFGVSPDDFHRHNAHRLQNWPHSLLTTSTHDTKRSEDVRARLDALSELPDDWQAALARWSRLNAAKKTIVEGQPAPDHNDEYLLYQTLLGVWPTTTTDDTLAPLRPRVAVYMQKATKEAKVHTSWINPNEEYDSAVAAFVSQLLAGPLNEPFLHDLLAFQRRLTFFGFFNSLAQTLLKLASPGVPDIYQGTELWDFSLVDPDNRRPVDYARRSEWLAGLKQQIKWLGNDLVSLARQLLADPADGRIKLYLIYRGLRFRRKYQQLFARGDYLPLEAEGSKAAHVVAFARSLDGETVLAVVPRLVVGLVAGAERSPVGTEVWKDTRLLLPSAEMKGRYRNILTGEVLVPEDSEPSALPMAAVLANFPVALLHRGN